MNDLLLRWTHPTIGEDGNAALKNVIASGQWSYGPVAQHMEQELATRLGVQHVVLTNSGTSALWLTLSRLRRPTERQSIIVPAFGYSAAANVAAALGFDLYIADCQADAPVVDPESVKKLIDRTTVAIVGINYFGYSVAWDQLPKQKSILIIEDSAGSFGAKYHDTPLGSQTDMAIFSFHTSKAVAAGGEGGAVVSNNSEIVDYARSAARSGHTTGYYYADKPGMNMLMSDVAASFLHDTFMHVDDQIAKRQQAVNYIEEIFTDCGHPTLGFNHSGNGRVQNYQAFTICTKNRDTVLALLRLNGVEARPCWPYLITELPATQAAVQKIDGGTLVNSKKFADEIINIPVNPVASEAQNERLSSVIQALVKAGYISSTEAKENRND